MLASQSRIWHSFLVSIVLVAILSIRMLSYLLRMGQNCLTKHALKLIFYAHIRSHVQYGLRVWGNECSSKSKKLIQNQLNKCITLVKKGKESNANTNGTFLNLDQLIKLENFKLGFKLMHNELPNRLIKILRHDKNKKSLTKQHQYNTRNKDQLNIPKHSSLSYHKSFLTSCIRDFATLPSSVLSSQEYHSFVHKCKNLLLTSVEQR